MRTTFALLVAPLVLLGCEQHNERVPAAQSAQSPLEKKPTAGSKTEETTFYVDPGAQAPEPVRHAVAIMHPTKGHEVRGVVRFESIKGQKGLRVTAKLDNVPPGKHAYHIHLLGDCTGPDAETADTHFNFQGPSRTPPKDIARITGDLGEVEPGAGNKASATAVIADASLQGRYSIIGRSVVVHEKGNDPTKPPIGGAGGRIACGVIGIDAATP